MKTTKSIQARLQSRISLRAAVIRDIEEKMETCKAKFSDKGKLKRLVEEQSLDKEIMSKVYWRM